MIDKNRIAILGSVPVVMIINLMLLNRYAGANPVVQKTDFTVNNTAPKEEKVVQTKTSNSGPIMSSRNKRKFVILYCPPPPPHTLCGPDPDE